jgi:hypothetical protein
MGLPIVKEQPPSREATFVGFCQPAEAWMSLNGRSGISRPTKKTPVLTSKCLAVDDDVPIIFNPPEYPEV